MVISYIVGIVLSYLLGSIPFGYLIAITKGIDIRTEGSGNIGATNVSRVLGRKYGLIIFFLDMFKAFVAVFFVPLLFGGVEFPTTADNLLVILCGFSAILGHAFPVSKTDRVRFLKKYIELDKESVKPLRYYIKSYNNTHAFHRLWWSVGGG